MSTFFEQELRKIINNTEEKDFTTYIGKEAYISLSPDKNVKIGIREMGYANHFEAIQFFIIHKDNGILDTLILKFDDIWKGKKAHIWFNGREYEWYIWQPKPVDYSMISEALQNYINLWT